MTKAMWGMALAAALAAGCGSTVSVGNDNPSGTVGGILQDATNEGALSGAAVTLVTGAATLTATTDANGVFQFTKVPAGSFIITFNAMNYIPVTLNRTLSGAAGNFPVNNPSLTIGPIQLIPSDGTFTVRLVSDAGSPVMGIDAQINTSVRYLDASSGARSAQGSFTVSAKSDANGLVSFAGLPNMSSLLSTLASLGTTYYYVTVAPTKVMGAELYDFFGVEQMFNLTSIGQDIPTIVLAGPRSPLSVVQSNVSALFYGNSTAAQTPIAGAGPIVIAFNQAIDPTSVRVNFFTDDGKPSPAQVMATANLNVLSLTPTPAFAAGARMSMNIHVISRTQTQAFDRANVPVFVLQTAPLAVTAKYDTTNNTVNLTFNDAIGPGGGAYLGYGFDCITFFENADFGPNVYQGEWVADPTKLSCPTYNPPGSYPTPLPGPGVDVTAMHGTGDQLATTGFSTLWQVSLGDPALEPNGCIQSTPAYPCMLPNASGTRIHLVFSKLGIGQSFRRANGDTINDTLVADIH